MATDREIRDRGFKYIPEQQYLKYPFELPQDQEPVTNSGIVNTNAFMNSGMDSGGNFNNIYGSGYDETIGAPGASPFLNMSQLNYPIGNPDTVIYPGVRLGGGYLPPGTKDFNKQMFETGPYADPYAQTDYNKFPMADPLNQKIASKLREDGKMDAKYTDEELIDMYGNQNFKGGMFEDEEDEKFNFMDYIPFVGDKSIMQGILKALPQNDPRATSIRDYYGGQGNLTSTGSIASGLMTGYNPVSGGFLNTITDGRFGSPTKYGLQRAYQKRIDTINKTEKRRGGLSKELTERREKLREEKAAELRALQTAQSRKDYNTIQDAYQNQTGAGSSYSGGDNTRSARTTGNYDDPFAPGDAD